MNIFYAAFPATGGWVEPLSFVDQWISFLALQSVYYFVFEVSVAVGRDFQYSSVRIRILEQFQKLLYFYGGLLLCLIYFWGAEKLLVSSVKVGGNLRQIAIGIVVISFE